MITVKLTEHSIRMDGHACRKVNGQDIVCSAISALTCNLLNSLSDLTDNKIRAENESGRMVIEWEHLTEQGKLLVDSWFLGLANINQEYNCIKFVN